MDKEEIKKLIKKETKELKAENERLRKKIKSLEKGTNSKAAQTSSNKDQEISRRSFLRKAGLGTAGLAAMALSPSAALDIRSEDLNFYNSSSSTSPLLEVDTNGYVDVDTLFVNAVYETESNLPSSAPEGSQAYIKSTNSIYVYGA